MSIPLTSIDCPHLTDECLEILFEKYAIRTNTDFLLWKHYQQSDRSLPSATIECIQSCILAHTGSISSRSPIDKDQIEHYSLYCSVFDQDDLLRNRRHLMMIYECFNQLQWNAFFNLLLIRLFLFNPSVSIHYLNTNASLFDLQHFYHHYCSSNETIRSQRDHIFEKRFVFQTCFHLDHFEAELDSIEHQTNTSSSQILIIDDFLTLIRPYLGLDHRIRNKIYQLTYRLNRLAQKQSLLIINGLIFSVLSTRFDCFHADQYVLYQSWNKKDLRCQILGKTNLQKPETEAFKFDLDQWADLNKVI